MRRLITTVLAAVAWLGPQAAQSQSAVSGPEVEACQASALIALKERNAVVHDVIFEPNTLSVTKAETSVGDTKIKTVILGLADIQTSKKDKPHQFVCLIGEKGKVLLTFFTDK